ncbi:Short chain dehydrogenase [Roseomonas mucosa]|uniref:SDR family oxidoreductase n=1 Tax=Roseomonas mucosa TaxID=207340 RepID=UPI00220CC2C1|nr:SDR family oxidoreductase [Roseomonas mucosa]QDJ07858.1 Short chain dehydrogenase [Roseomonas mucosa]
MSRFSGKRILVTGATSGIGRAGALRIAAEGGQVIATGRDPDRLAALRQALPEAALVLRNDAADPGAARELAEAVASGGGLDGAWLNAGYAAVCAIEAVDAEFFDAMMQANLRGPVLQMACLSSLLRPGGAVLLTGSTAAYEGSAMASVYAASKGAMLSLARCWATALGPRGIRVNTLVPGPIDTNFRDFMADSFRRDFEAGVLGRLALSRMGRDEEAAAVALFLLSEEAGFVTGGQYAVDGGLAMR